jgi:hypothetical protein
VLSKQYHYHLGMAYHKNGQHDKAREILVLTLAGATEFVGRADAEKVLQSLIGG